MLRSKGHSSLLLVWQIWFEDVWCVQAKNPRKAVPISIVGAMTICTILYVLMCMAITLARPYNLIDAQAPFSVLFKTIPGWHWASYLVAVGAVIGVGTVVLVRHYHSTTSVKSLLRKGASIL